MRSNVRFNQGHTSSLCRSPPTPQLPGAPRGRCLHTRSLRRPARPLRMQHRKLCTQDRAQFDVLPILAAARLPHRCFRGWCCNMSHLGEWEESLMVFASICRALPCHHADLRQDELTTSMPKSGQMAKVPRHHGEQRTLSWQYTLHQICNSLYASDTLSATTFCVTH